MEAQNLSSQEQDKLAGDVMESLGEPEGAQDEINMSHEASGEASPSEDSSDPLYVQKRLKQQKRQHEREIRELHARMADLQQKLSPQPSYGQEANPYGGQAQPGSIDEQIHKAVSYALQHKEMEERKAKEAQNQMHIQKKYKELYNHLDKMGDKYDDFHDIVLGDEAQFTPAMRDYALTMPKTGSGSAGEVLYQLGKNPAELERIAKLHPTDQAEEMLRLSHALISGGAPKGTQSRPLNQIKSTPVSNSHIITDKTPVASIRERMKSGKWK